MNILSKTHLHALNIFGFSNDQLHKKSKKTNPLKMTAHTQEYREQARQTQHDIDFHGAALIDENGEEIPLTNDMVNQALVHAQAFQILSPNMKHKSIS